MEQWRGINDFPKYEVSDEGRVRNLKTRRILKPGKHRQGYSLVWLSDSGTTRGRSIHRLVAEAFIPNPESKPEVNHLDGNKSNNRVDNLEWNTSRENMQHAYKTSLCKGRSRTKVRIVETDEVFASIVDCAKHVNGDPSNICGCIHGRHKTHKGLHFEAV